MEALIRIFWSKKKSLSESIEELYPVTLGDEPLYDAGSLINTALYNIFTGKTAPGGIDPSLWQISYKELNKAVDSVFVNVQYGEPNFDFIEQLKVNNGVFSAFKTHNQTKELAAILSDADGNLKSFSAFRKDAESVIGKYNRQWLKTEYNTAVRSARSAANWKTFEADADLYPNLEYLPSRSADRRPEHVALYGTVLSINHPWWNTHTPPLDWNCKCGITNTDKEPSRVPTKNIRVAAGLDNNPAKTSKLFSDSHPYINKVKKRSRPDISRQSMRFERKLLHRYAKAKLTGKKYSTQNHSNIHFTNRNSKEWLNQPHRDYRYKNRLLLTLDDVMNKAVFVRTDINKKGGLAKIFHYYRVELQGRDSYIVIKELSDETLQIYSMVDSLLKENG